MPHHGKPVTCESCGAFESTCWVPTGDGGAREVCWLCAHFIAEHGHAIGERIGNSCECPREQIYPTDVLAIMNEARRARRALVTA